MNSDELRALTSDMMTASLSVLGPENRSAPFDIDRDCRDTGGQPSGRVYVGRAYNSNLPSRDVGLQDLRALSAAWSAAGYAPRAETRWDRPSVSVLVRHESTGIDLAAGVNIAGKFHIFITSQCAELGPVDKRTQETGKSSDADAAEGPAVGEIRNVLG
ncbi:hypothetical protein OG216_21145 [Streptomycetaceae bacterium NBC_01309]